MTDIVQAVKDHFKIGAYVAPYTGGLSRPKQTRYGEYMNGWCPWCQNGQRQRKQSRRFWVNTKTGLCNCMHPGCSNHKPMDVINFHARLWNLTNDQAIHDLHVTMGTFSTPVGDRLVPTNPGADTNDTP